MDVSTSTVHGKPLKAGEARFFITRVMRDAEFWKEFEVDVMCVGAPIMWKIADVIIPQNKAVSKQGTEATNPVLLDVKKKKGACHSLV